MMTNLHDSQPTPRFAFRQRWVSVGIVTVLLHLLLLGWADGRFRPMVAEPVPVKPASSANVMMAMLQPVPIPPPAAPLPAPPPAPRRSPRPPAKSAAVAKSTPKPAPSPPIIPALMSPPASPVQPVIAAEPEIVAGIADDPAAATTASGVSSNETMPSLAAASTVPDAASPTPPVPTFKVKPPPSAALTYDVRAFRNGKNWYGSGEIKWQSDGRNYMLTGAASISALMFKVTALNFWSKGQIDEFGVAPLLYSETRFRKAETNTHFRRDPNLISFSASTATYPRNGGAQDRASIMWQLAAIGNGDPEKFLPGAEIDLFVAGVRDAETWRIRVIDEESVDLAIGKMRAWHVSRAPRSGSYEQKIDIWLAPQQHWYPVKILYTEANGDYLDLSLARLTDGTEQ